MSSFIDEIGLLDTPADFAAGRPMQLAIALIDEDPSQPRTEFKDDSLAELAATIAERGVRSPISVRPHPDEPGRWMLNFGSRRLRASRMANKETIPAFIDTCADDYDQVIENEQRESLTPMELALFVQRRITAGETQVEIARRLGKSQPFVSYTTALIDAPDWLLAAYREGTCRGLKELYDLRRLHRLHPQDVEVWLSSAGKEPVTRGRLDELRSELASPRLPSTETGKAVAEIVGEKVGGGRPTDLCSAQRAEPALAVHGSGAGRAVADKVLATFQVERNGERLVVDLHQIPDEPGRVFVRPVCGGTLCEVEVVSLTLIGFVKATAPI